MRYFTYFSQDKQKTPLSFSGSHLLISQEDVTNAVQADHLRIPQGVAVSILTTVAAHTYSRGMCDDGMIPRVYQNILGYTASDYALQPTRGREEIQSTLRSSWCTIAASQHLLRLSVFFSPSLGVGKLFSTFVKHTISA